MPEEKIKNLSTLKKRNPISKDTGRKSKVEKKISVEQSEVVKRKKPVVTESTNTSTETKKKASVESSVSSVNKGLKLDVLNTAGEKDGTITLPKNVFGVKVNPKLIAQAVRVFLMNQRMGTASTKTRGEVDGSTRKIYRQKGTGRARHGGLRAPIFVKGGIAHGPTPKDYELLMPKKMKQAALLSALSSKAKDEGVRVITGLELLESKTKAYAVAFDKWGFMKKSRNVLLVLPKDAANIYRSARNLAGVSITTANRIHTYEVIQHKMVIFMKDAITTLEEKFKNKE